MKAKYDTWCKVCDKALYKDAEIAILLGSWAHAACKAQRLADIAAQGNVTHLMPQGATWSEPQRFRTKGKALGCRVYGQ